MSDINDLIDRLTPRQQREYALKCARRVQHLVTDPRSIAVLDVGERHLRGEATDEELAKTSWTARDAVWASACDAAADAARAAMWAASCDAAEEAAAACVRAASAAARDAAWAAERAWQREELERMLKEGGGA